MSTPAKPNDSKAILESLDLEASFYEQFFDARFDATAIDAVEVDSTVQRLRFGISQIEDAINREVADKHSTLLETALGARDLSKLVIGLEGAARDVQSSLQKVHRQFLDRYDSFEKLVRQQGRLQSVLYLLRRVYRFLDLVNKLKRAQQNGFRDLSKAGSYVAELEECIADEELREVDTIKTEMAYVKKAGQVVRSSAASYLQSALESYSIADVGAYAQVFHNLNNLTTKVDDVITATAEKFRTSLSSVILHRRKESSASPSTSIWEAVEEGFGVMVSGMDRISLLEKALEERKDAVTQIPLIQSLDASLHSDEQSLVETGWVKLCQVCHDVLKEAQSQKGSPVIDVLITEYPRLASLLRRLFLRVSSSTNGAVKKPQHQDALVLSAEGVLNAFLSKSFARVSETIDGLFVSRTEPPSEQKVEGFLGLLRRETEFSLVETTVCKRFLLQTAKAIQLFGRRAQQEVISSPEAFQIVGQANATQAHNAALYNAVVYLEASADDHYFGPLRKKAAEFKQRAETTAAAEDSEEFVRISEALIEGVKEMNSVLQTLETTSSEMLEPLFSAAFGKMEQTSAGLQMMVTDSSKRASGAQGMSSLAKELRRQTNYFNESILRQYRVTPQLHYCKVDFAKRLLRTFIFQACLVRVESEDASLAIASDIPQVKLACVTLVKEKDIASELECLKQLNSLLFMETSQVPNSLSSFDRIPLSAVAHHLLSRGPSSLRLPFRLSDFALLPSSSSSSSSSSSPVASFVLYGRWLAEADDATAAKWVKRSLEAFSKLSSIEKYSSLVENINKVCEAALSNRS